MKTGVFENVREMFETACERVRLWVVARKKRKSGSNILEVYSIKEEYMGKEYVKSFLEERMRIAVRNGYAVEFNNNYVSEGEEEIGCVTLLCRGRFIDRAILTAGEETRENDRLIHWNFK